MDIDSVRALKLDVSQRLVTPAVNRAVSAFSMAAMSLGRTAGHEPAIALGVARGAGAKDYHLAVRIQRRSLEANRQLHDRISAAAKGEVDVRYVGRIAKQDDWNKVRQRPLLIGASVGHFAITAGTTGAFVNSAGAMAILSNNHVLANENRAAVGDAILQPGNFDGGSSTTDLVANLSHFIPLNTAVPNLFDAAVATLAAGVAPNLTTLTGKGVLTGLRAAPLEPGETVFKVGRTTDLTQGKVTAIEVDSIVINYETGNMTFNRQVEIEGAATDAPFSAGGDSGSLIFDADGAACALLFAGGDTGGSNGMGLTYANDLAGVLAALNVTLAI